MVKPRRPPEPIPTGLTLAALEAEADALTGTATRLAERLAAYRGGRDEQAALRADDRRDAIGRACLAAMMRGVDTDGRYRLHRVDVPDKISRRLTSVAVRRASPQLWAASRVPGYRLTVSTDALSAPRVAAVRSGTVGQLIETLRHDARRAVLAAQAVDTARAELIGVYEAIDAARPWGGAVLATVDGWAIGYTPTLTFSRAVCRALADEQSIDTAPMMTEQRTRGGVRWRVIDATADAEHLSDGDATGDAYAP